MQTQQMLLMRVLFSGEQFQDYLSCVAAVEEGEEGKGRREIGVFFEGIGARPIVVGLEGQF